jgi:hypothetical protein
MSAKKETFEYAVPVKESCKDVTIAALCYEPVSRV